MLFNTAPQPHFQVYVFLSTRTKARARHRAMQAEMGHMLCMHASPFRRGPVMEALTLDTQGGRNFELIPVQGSMTIVQTARNFIQVDPHNSAEPATHATGGLKKGMLRRSEIARIHTYTYVSHVPPIPRKVTIADVTTTRSSEYIQRLVRCSIDYRRAELWRHAANCASAATLSTLAQQRNKGIKPAETPSQQCHLSCAGNDPVWRRHPVNVRSAARCDGR